MEISITNIPNTEAALKAAKRLKISGHRLWLRPRGARGSNKRWHQDLPRERATHFHAYQFPYAGRTYEPYDRWECTGVDKAKGKLRMKAID